MTRDELLSQALMGLAVIERVLVPGRGELADDMLDTIRESDTRFEDLKDMYRQLLFAASMLTTYGADEAGIPVEELLDRLRGSMLAARFSGVGGDAE